MKLIKESDEILEEVLTYEPPIPEHITDEDVLLALDKVPEDFREVLLLSDVQEFSYKEIADTLQIPIGTVMSRLSRGRKVLRAHLAELAPNLKVRKAKEGEHGI